MKELDNASKKKPRLLVCAPSNTAVDNIILKIMEGGFVDGKDMIKYIFEKFV